MSRPQAEPPELPGLTFVRALGSGGFSDVYLYQQERPRRQVAVKVLHVEELTDAARDAFDAEANAMAAVSAHSNIVSIYQADISDDGRPYFVMAYYGGPTLAESYKRAPLGVVDALRIGIRLAGAVATAHSHGILHRDIKPGNVLTNEYGAIGLTDFGISSRVETSVPTGTTTSWAIGGAGSTNGTESHGMSIPWSPPESFDDDPDPDVRSDLFSLAATIYTLLAGRTPFERPREPNYENDLVGRILRGAITPMERTDVPSSLVAVLRKAMSVDRSARFSDVVQFARALQRVEIELGYTETPLEAPGLTVEATQVESGDDGDRTRARAITSIPAQAAAPTSAAATRARALPVVRQADPTPVVVPADLAVSATGKSRASGASTPAAIPEATVIRTAAPEISPVTEPEAVVRPRRRGRFLLVLGALAAVIATVVVVALVVSTAPDPRAGDDPGEVVVDGSEGPVIGDVVPTPEILSAQYVGDGSATIVWSNPDPQPDDSYIWMRTDPTAPDSSPHETTETSVTIDGVTPGVPACVSIEIVRAGQGSAQPAEVCI